MGLIVIITAIPAIIIVGIVAVVAGKTGRAVERLGMAITAGSAAVVDSTPAFIGNARMRTAIFGRPVVHRMTGSAVESEQAGMISRVSMAARTGGGDLHKFSASMTALTGQTHMPTG